MVLVVANPNGHFFPAFKNRPFNKKWFKFYGPELAILGFDGFFTQVQPKADAVQEVTVSTAVPGAESGGEGAVQVRFVTKSGTSEFHGGGFWQ